MFPLSGSSGSNHVPMAWAVTVMAEVTLKYLGLWASAQQVAGIPLPARANRPVATSPIKSPGEASQPISAPHAASQQVPTEGAHTSLICITLI